MKDAHDASCSAELASPVISTISGGSFVKSLKRAQVSARGRA